MTLWENAKTGPERDAAIRKALAESDGSITGASERLGVSRRHLTRYLTENPRLRRPTETSEPPETSETRSLTETSLGVQGGETPTDLESLTYRNAGRTLRYVNGLDAMNASATHKVTFDLPDDCLQYLENEALRRKQSGATRRMAKTPIVVEMIRDKMNGGDQ